jgi:uncharacterized protein (UPF0179 family)
MQEVKKEYVSILAQIHMDGAIQPLCILLEDGRKFDIYEVKNKCRAASLKAGGCGIRYTVRIGERDTYLFDEDGRWFVEMRLSS